jgi:hypothetical protein
MSMEFSRTDPKDAYLVATVAQRGAYHAYEQFPPESHAMHLLAITLDKPGDHACPPKRQCRRASSSDVTCEAHQDDYGLTKKSTTTLCETL